MYQWSEQGFFTFFTDPRYNRGGVGSMAWVDWMWTRGQRSSCSPGSLIAVGGGLRSFSLLDSTAQWACIPRRLQRTSPHPSPNAVQFGEPRFWGSGFHCHCITPEEGHVEGRVRMRGKENERASEDDVLRSERRIFNFLFPPFQSLSPPHPSPVLFLYF
ncbi:UNVERIFIED_CONTAM: hypothetical protein K2H54_015238 [Gekko kuhli]